MTLQELFTDESKWTKGSFARDMDGNAILADNPKAMSWCIIGGLIKCYPLFEDRNKILSKLHASHGNIDLGDFNDSQLTTFKDIQELVKELDI